MWELILAPNALCNDLAHNLTSPKRVERTKRILVLLGSEQPEDASNGPLPDVGGHCSVPGFSVIL